MRIFLIGFMGSGKTTSGLKLAEAIDFDFFDLDDIVEDSEACSISEMFNTKGEFYFREIERNCLHNMIQLHKCIIATGGGTPCFFDNIDWMNHNGITIYLKTSPEVLLERVKSETANRPLLNEIGEEELLEFIKRKLIDRSPFYEKAHFILDVDNIADVSGELKRFILKIIGH